MTSTCHNNLSSTTGTGPLHRQVSDSLLQAIANGRFAPGEALPGEHALCARFGVSRITVRKALEELARRGAVVRRQGAGTFVGQPKDGLWSVTLTGIIEDVLTPNDLQIVREAMCRPPADVLRFAGLAPGLRLKLFEGTNRMPGDVPLVHVRYYFPKPIAALLAAEAFSGPVQAIKVVERVSGRRVDHAEQIVEPAIADERLGRFLQIPAGTAVLRAIRVYYDAELKPIEIFDAAYHPTNYRYTATLYPRGA